VTPTILGGLQENRVARTASFDVLVSLGLASEAVGHLSHRSKSLSGTGAHMEAFVDSLSVTALLARGSCCR
jgi:hypothetical protein